jgi:hypothetical protein
MDEKTQEQVEQTIKLVQKQQKEMLEKITNRENLHEPQLYIQTLLNVAQVVAFVKFLVMANLGVNEVFAEKAIRQVCDLGVMVLVLSSRGENVTDKELELWTKDLMELVDMACIKIPKLSAIH